MVITAGVAFARNGSSLIVHLPSAAAVAVFDWPANLIVIASPGSALPQIGIALPCCSTMPSLRTSGKVTWARATIAHAKKKITVENLSFIFPNGAEGRNLERTCRKPTSQLATVQPAAQP